MTRLRMTFAIATLTVSLAPAAQAYAVGPETTDMEISVVERINVLMGATADHQDGICALSVTPVLATALGLSMPLEARESEGEFATCEAE
ncbi:hypothetical protein SAMN04488515_0523 [Cognatiyoonia koreensis]|uniref:UrcA family protein n=1 Tax=Cognatiyoonia koreensis TaxID=364200 RepID=A0A1I0NBJ5_9RHOB|nr:hypothetical protein [Cognatiyoonia koreensis]SEV98595.1 hypothetical protein SAMN04488515_0523 [Cognatiyoonia koreensis]